MAKKTQVTHSLEYKIRVMQAALDGQPIERQTLDGDWEYVKHPMWNWQARAYRVGKEMGPEIDWNQVHPRFLYLARDEDGKAFLYETRPTKDKKNWGSIHDYTPADSFASYVPGSCDWKDSLVSRFPE